MMLASCIPWTHVLYEKLLERPRPRCQCKHLPEDVIAEILSRLPERCVFKCQTVCKQWRSLILSTSFYQMYVVRATPTLILYKPSDLLYETIFVSEWDDIINMSKPKVEKICASEILPVKLDQSDILRTYSLNGFLAVYPVRKEAPHVTTLYNPFTQEKLIVHSHYVGRVCGVFFHPKSREYRLLWTQGGFFLMICLGLQKKPYWRRLSNITCRPIVGNSPVNLNGALHWLSIKFYSNCGKKHLHADCSNSITIFNIETEEFCMMPHPRCLSECHRSIGSFLSSHNKLHIFSLEGRLAICKLWKIKDSWFSRFYGGGVLEICILEDYTKWAWTKTHHIKLNLNFWGGYRTAELLGFQNGALVFHIYEKGLFAYHLQRKTSNKFLFGKDRERTVSPRLHTKSLRPLGEFEPVTIMLDW